MPFGQCGWPDVLRFLPWESKFTRTLVKNSLGGAHVAGHDRPSGLRDCFHPSQVNEDRRGQAACPPFPYDELDNAYLLPGPEIPANSPRKAGSDMVPLLRMLQSRACCLGAPQRIRGRQPKKLRGGGAVEPPRRHPPDVVEPSRGALKLRERERRNSHG